MYYKQCLKQLLIHLLRKRFSFFIKRFLLRKAEHSAQPEFLISTLYRLKHLLRHRLLPLRPFQFLSGILQVLQPLQFVLCILKAQMRIGVKRNPYIAMPHKVLQRLRVHSGFRHIAAIRVAANMWRDIGHE